jgi:RecB family exonuclease
LQFSHSRIETFKSCLYKYKLRYIDKLQTVPDQAADNALYLGTALHKGIETDVTTAIREYFNNYYVITDQQINEAIKLEYLIPKVKEVLQDVNIYAQEFRISSNRFIGYADLITKNKDGTVDIFDFKYSNNIQNYLESDQLHIYKYFLEQQGFKVDKLGFIFIPKISIKEKKTEDIYQFRKRLVAELETAQIQLIPIKYNKNKVGKFFNNIINTYEITGYTKNPTRLCDWCDYKLLCMKGENYMILPENKRREKKIDTNPDMWLYGASYAGKSTFVDQFDNLLFLNTDGNTDNTTSPVIRIKDEVTQEGRLTKRKFAWQVFTEAVAELEKKDNSFKRVALDLVEDLYEDCRLYMYDKLGIQHEQDAGYGKGWDMVRTEFLSNIKRLKNCGYQIIYISKEVTSEIIKKNGDKITTIKPNIPDKVANVLAGTVDLTARVVADGDNRYLSFKNSPFIFGGGRFNFGVNQIELNKKKFIETLKNVQGLENKPTEENHDDTTANNSENVKQETTKKRHKKVDETEGPKTEQEESKIEQEQPVHHRRKHMESEDK